MAARRCCVCRRFKGVGVEVHHIVPEADGGDNSLGNAIVLCFDCHCAAGHYNPKHPRGTKFSRGELRKHRDAWIQKVTESGVDALEPGEFDRYYSRHLLCLDNDAVGDLLDMNRERIPFRYDYVLSTSVLEFMRVVLADNPPHAWQSSLGSPGHYWGDDRYRSIRHFHECHPEFEGRTSRPLVASDFSDSGLVPSRIMRRAVEAGLSPAEIGEARVEEAGCGAGPDYFVSMRRPLFVFAELKNTSDEPIVLSGLMVRTDRKHEFVRKFSAWGTGDLLAHDYRNLTIGPGEVLLVPECVVLSGRSYDPMDTVFEIEYEMSVEQVQSVGLAGAGVSKDLYVIGPASKVEGYKLIAGDKETVVSIHAFEPDKCYLYFRAWMVGSCPHLYVYDRDRGWRHLQEILSGSSSGVSACEHIELSEGVERIRIVETDYENTIIETLRLNDEELIDRPMMLWRGDEVEFEISGPGTLTISGKYVANIMSPDNYLQLRQKHSLRAAYEIRQGIERSGTS